jgi:hypothetical protein
MAPIAPVAPVVHGFLAPVAAVAPQMAYGMGMRDVGSAFCRLVTPL